MANSESVEKHKALIKVLFAAKKRKRKKVGQSSTTSSHQTSISTRSLELIVEKLKSQCHRDSTRKMYYLAWKKFAEFFQKLDVKPQTWEERIVLYIGYLVDTKKQSSTIKSYLSAIRAVLKIDGVKLSEDMFLVSSLTKACRLLNDKVKTRKPIPKNDLERLLHQVQSHFENDEKGINQPYLKILYQTLFATAYYGMFRIGELTAGSHPILAEDVQVGQNKNQIKFTLRSSKTHAQYNNPQVVKISSMTIPDRQAQGISEDSKFCLYQLLRIFGRIRGPCHKGQPFFVFRDGSPVKPNHMSAVLKTILLEAGMNPSNFSVHSFRIGRSSDLLKLGLSVETIKKLGRWKSNAVFRYFCEK